MSDDWEDVPEDRVFDPGYQKVFEGTEWGARRARLARGAASGTSAEPTTREVVKERVSEIASQGPLGNEADPLGEATLVERLALADTTRGDDDVMTPEKAALLADRPRLLSVDTSAVEGEESAGTLGRAVARASDEGRTTFEDVPGIDAETAETIREGDAAGGEIDERARAAEEFVEVVGDDSTVMLDPEGYDPLAEIPDDILEPEAEPVVNPEQRPDVTDSPEEINTVEDFKKWVDGDSEEQPEEPRERSGRR